MSLTRRLTHLMRVKAHTALTRANQRQVALDTPEHRAAVEDAEVALFEATATVERLEREGRRLQAEAATLFERAMDEQATGRHAAAAEVLSRRDAIEPDLVALRAQHAEAMAEQGRLRARLEHVRG